MTRPGLRSALAVLAGLALWASFPPLGCWPAAVVGVAVLALVVRDSTPRQAARDGLCTGLGLWLPLLSFLRDVGVDAWLVVALIESLWFVALAVALRWVARLRWWPVAGALLWSGQELLRDRWPFGGFPWGRLAFGQAGGPLLRLAAVGGAPLVSVATALAGGLLALLLLSAWHRGSAVVGWRPGLAVSGLGVLVAGPLLIPLPTAGTSAHGPSSAVVAVVQGNVPRLGLDEFAQKRAVTAYHLAETRRLATAVAAGTLPRPQLVIWPENSSDLDPDRDLIARSMIDQAAAVVDVPLLVGAVLDGPGPDHLSNAAIVWSPVSGPQDVYLKRHLVPFGEYLPFRRVLSALVGRFALIPLDFAPGHRPGVLQVGPVRLGDTICFEVADDRVVRQAVTAGGRLLAVQTNNADYEHRGDSGRGGETGQQLAIARLRAVEHGRAVVVSATSGVSAVIAPDGTVQARTGIYSPAVLDRRVPLRDPLTVADRVGSWPEAGLGVGALLSLLAGLLDRRRRCRTAPRPVAVPIAKAEAAVSLRG